MRVRRQSHHNEIAKDPLKEIYPIIQDENGDFKLRYETINSVRH